ncbi:MAG: hypothetical protein ACTSQQ_03590, partial [Candidatus Helarchaeota archaeon]
LFNLSSSNWIDATDIPYISPVNRTLPDGTYQIFAWANDTAGNIQEMNESFTINAYPTVSIDWPIDTTYLSQSISINLSCSDPDLDRMWFRVWNESGWVTNNVTWYVGANITLDDGNYTLFAWANDTHGYISVPAVVNFTINSNPPPLNIESPLNTTYWEGTVLINLTSSASDLAMIWYRLFNLSSSSWIDTTDITYVSPVNRMLPDGLYRIFAWANDTAGNTQEVNKSFTINAPPTVSVDLPLNTTYTSQQKISINLTCTALDLDQMWYQIHNGTQWVTTKIIWEEGANITLPDGTYVLYAWANDTLGQTQPVPSNVSFAIDSTPPTVSILAPLNDTYHSSSILINISSSAGDIHRIWYRLYDRAAEMWVDIIDVLWTSPTQRVLADGSYGLFVWANDTYGNTLSVPENVNFTVDAPPYIAYLSIVNETTYVSAILLNISVEVSDLDTIWYAVFDGASWGITNTTWTAPVSLVLPDGDYALYIWVNDTQGNVDVTVISFGVRLPSDGGSNWWIWVVIIVVGVVSAVAIVYRMKKSKAKKGKTKVGAPDAAKTFAERVKPLD